MCSMPFCDARLAVFPLLVRRGPTGHTATELAEGLDVPVPTLTLRLHELAHAGLVVSQRKEQNVRCGSNLERVRALVNSMTQSCGSLADESCNANCLPAAVDLQK